MCPTCKQDFTGEVRLGLARARWNIAQITGDYERRLNPYERLNAADRLAQALQDCAGDDAGALPLFEEVLAVSRQVDGDDDINTLVSMNNLASLQHKMGKSDLALPLFEEALAAQRRTLGRNVPDTLRTVSNLAVLHLRAGRFSLSLPLAEEALGARRKLLGSEHTDTLESTHVLGLLRWHMAHGEFVSFGAAAEYAGPCDVKELELAARLLREALEGRHKLLGELHHLTQESAKALGHAEQRISDIRAFAFAEESACKEEKEQPTLAKRRRQQDLSKKTKLKKTKV
jgi:tetratricopeptide (TPR) repeat protein